jgi:hypothetical protein
LGCRRCCRGAAGYEHHRFPATLGLKHPMRTPLLPAEKKRPANWYELV